jgi:hypothetical protein
VFARVVDGLAFRYYWATEGLRPEDYEFRPGPASMATKELLKHVLHLALMVKQCVDNAPKREAVTASTPESMREKTLEILRSVRERLLTLDDATLEGHRVLKSDGSGWPLWNILNGPLADALTHVGQLNAWRRLNGNPVPPANVFSGKPPAE